LSKQKASAEKTLAKAEGEWLEFTAEHDDAMAAE